MKKKLILAAGVLFLMGCLAGCGKKTSTEDVALVTESSIQGDLLSQIETTAQQYASDNGLTLNVHQAASSDVSDYEVAIQEAADAGATAIIGYGEDFEIPLYTMQKKYKKVDFIIIDGEPRKAEDKSSELRKNTTAIVFNERQAGFLAGYAAVKDGYKNIGFMGGIKESSVAAYGSGFVQGANYAAQEMSLTSSDVTIRYTYLGTNDLSPSVMAQADAWYSDGCELIFTNGGSIGAAVLKAAQDSSAKVITSDVATTSDGQCLVTSAVKNVNDILTTTLDDIFNGDFDEGKTTQSMDLSNDGVSLVMDSAVFNQFTETDYSDIVSKITGGDVTVSDKYVSALTRGGDALANVTVNFVSADS